MSTDTLDEFRDSARDFLGRGDYLRRTREMRNHPAGFERDVWRSIAEAGWLSVLLPESQGGLGLGLREITAIGEEAGTHLLPEPFVAAGVQFARMLTVLPDNKLRNELIAQLTEGGLIAGVAWQEAPDQDDRSAIDTTAVDGGGSELILNGRKRFVVPGSAADGWVVSAMRAGRPALFWVPSGTSGLACEDERRVDGSMMTSLTLSQVRVPTASMLVEGDAALDALAAANDAARIAQGAELIGVARRALALTLEYLNTRHQFGKPIGSFQALQHRAVDAFIQVELAAACVTDALANIDHAPHVTSAMASRVKARCTHAALFVTRQAIQFHGAMGFTDECDVGLYFKRALALSSHLGNAPVHRRRYFSMHGGEPAQHAASDRDVATPSRADWDAMPEHEFRRMVRSFFQRNYPAHLRNMPHRLHWPEIRDWYYTLSRQGWIAPAWPSKFGGMGLPPDKLLAFIDEQEKFGVARAPDQGIVMVGPLLIKHGNPQQQQAFLPKILSGEHIWCQGYSEPNAGSDLASLRTEAVVDGDHFVVNGQKIWCTLAQDATHIFLLVRTDKTARKQSGISFLLVDLATPGVTIRPIRDIAGHEEFCEVFFDNVRVPRENMVGEMNGGWTIAKTLLSFERIFLGSPRQSQFALAQLDQLARARKLFDDPAFVARFAEVQLDVADLAASYAHFAAIVKRGENLPASVSMLKIFATETYQKIGMLLVESANESAGQSGDMLIDEQRMNILAPLFNATSATIYGGTNEIQRNIIAKQVLNLPD